MIPHSLQTAERLEDLKEVAQKLGIGIQYSKLGNDDFPIKSGYCKLRGESWVFLDRQLPVCQQMEILLEVIARFDLDDIYLASWIREHIESSTNTVTEQ